MSGTSAPWKVRKRGSQLGHRFLYSACIYADLCVSIRGWNVDVNSLGSRISAVRSCGRRAVAAAVGLGPGGLAVGGVQRLQRLQHNFAQMNEQYLEFAQMNKQYLDLTREGKQREYWSASEHEGEGVHYVC
eukprot:3338107-Rhodomonas_salina.1